MMYDTQLRCVAEGIEEFITSIKFEENGEQNGNTVSDQDTKPVEGN